MRINIPSPPTGDKDTKETLSSLISWLFSLAENLNVVLNSISEDNLAPSLRELIEELTERNDSGDIQN